MLDVRIFARPGARHKTRQRCCGCPVGSNPRNRLSVQATAKASRGLRQARAAGQTANRIHRASFAADEAMPQKHQVSLLALFLIAEHARPYWTLLRKRLVLSAWDCWKSRSPAARSLQDRPMMEAVAINSSSSANDILPDTEYGSSSGFSEYLSKIELFSLATLTCPMVQPPKRRSEISS